MSAGHLPHRRTQPGDKCGLTLVETLLAIAITMLVVGLVYSVYHTTTTVLRGQKERRRGPMAARRALELISRDMACAMHVFGDDSPAFTLEDEGAQAKPACRVSFSSAMRAEGADQHWFKMKRVTLRVVRDGKRRNMLVRETRDLAGPGALLPAQTNMLVEAVEQFRVELLNGEGWQSEWGKDSAGGWPRAARISIALNPGDDLSDIRTEVFIPVGNAITSRPARVSKQVRGE